MLTFASRAGRWPLAVTLTLLATLAACADRTTAPAVNTPSPAAANAAAPSPAPYTTTVDIVVERLADSPIYGTTVRLGLSCSTTQYFDLIVDLEQQVGSGKTKQLAQGSTTLFGYRCEPVNPALVVDISPTDPRFDFAPGRATVRAHIASFQPGVEPADITVKTRMVVD